MDHRSVCCDGHVVDELVDSTVWEEWWEDCGKRQSPKRKLWLAFTRRDPWFHSFWLHFFPCHLLRKTQVFVSFYPHPTSCLYTYIYFCFFFFILHDTSDMHVYLICFQNSNAFFFFCACLSNMHPYSFVNFRKWMFFGMLLRTHTNTK